MIGLHCPPLECTSSKTAAWTWMDKSVYNYTNWWSPDDPFSKYHCTRIYSQGKWDSTYCDLRDAFICKQNALLRNFETRDSPNEVTTPQSNNNEG